MIRTSTQLKAKVRNLFGGDNNKAKMLIRNFIMERFLERIALSQYRNYHIIVPHIMGFGDETERIFETDTCAEELYLYIKSLNKKVLLIGFSLGAQLAFKLVSDSVTMNTYTHLGFDDARDEMIRLEELEAAKREVEKVSGERPVTQKLFKAI